MVEVVLLEEEEVVVVSFVEKVGCVEVVGWVLEWEE